MPRRPRITITDEQWRKAANAYELGTHHAVQIAKYLGVSPATVSREFSRRGCRKGCRVEETVADLKAALDAKARARFRRQDLEQLAAMERLDMRNQMIGVMMKALIAADRAGNLSSVAPMVADVGRALRVKGRR